MQYRKINRTTFRPNNQDFPLIFTSFGGFSSTKAAARKRLRTHFTRLNRTSSGLFKCCSKDPFSSWKRDKEYTLAESASTRFFLSQAPLLFKASSYVDIL